MAAGLRLSWVGADSREVGSGVALGMKYRSGIAGRGVDLKVEAEGKG